MDDIEFLQHQINELSDKLEAAISSLTLSMGVIAALTLFSIFLRLAT